MLQFEVQTPWVQWVMNDIEQVGKVTMIQLNIGYGQKKFEKRNFYFPQSLWRYPLITLVTLTSYDRLLCTRLSVWNFFRLDLFQGFNLLLMSFHYISVSFKYWTRFKTKTRLWVSLFSTLEHHSICDINIYLGIQWDIRKCSLTVCLQVYK